MYNFFTKSIFVSKDVHFYERCFPYHHQDPNFVKQLFLTNNINQSTSIKEEDPNFQQLFQLMEQGESSSGGTKHSKNTDQHDTSFEPYSDLELHSNIRKSSRSHKTPIHLEDYVCNENLHCCNIIQYSALNTTHKQIADYHLKYTEPKSFAEASTNPLWIESMEKELKALNDNKT